MAFHPAAAALVLGLLTVLATAVCRSNKVPPPGSFFFVLMASILTVRLMDIVFGSVIGAIGGWVLHHPTWCRRRVEERVIRLPWSVLRDG